VLAYDNDFPALFPDAPTPPAPAGLPVGSPQVYRTAAAAGKCEVILYADNPALSLADIPLAQREKLVQLWAARTQALAETDPRVQYVFPFENRGPEVGVTIHHPHGQLYAYPFVPLKVETMLHNARAHFVQHQSPLLADMLATELATAQRVVFREGGWVGYLPHFTDYPYGLFLQPERQVGYLTELSREEVAGLASALGKVCALLDRVFVRPMPYMMCVYQCPVNAPAWADAPAYFSLHIQYFPVLRAADKIKYYASSEMGAWAAANVVAVEDTAAQLRELWVQLPV
jgi:UDPglucose--hexose-1-phosphate uridylyltransferase